MFKSYFKIVILILGSHIEIKTSQLTYKSFKNEIK